MTSRTKRSTQTACRLKTKDGLISFSLSRSVSRRTLSITIDEKAQVLVRAPSYSAEKEIHAFIFEKSSWITSKLKAALKVKSKTETRQFDHGYRFLFLGKNFPLQIIEKDVKRASIEFNGFKWICGIPRDLSPEQRRDIVKKKMVGWYRAQAQEVLGSRIFYYSRQMGIEPVKIAVRTQKRVWGNCEYRTRTIHINWQIILAPISVVDYVVVHEMCHMIVPNHSKKFWDKVESVLPNYKKEKLWLKDNYLNMLLP